MRVFVAGATGATGKFVVQQLLHRGDSVVAVARSKEKLVGLLQPTQAQSPNLTIHEGTLLDWSDEELQAKAKDCSAVVSCLGHNPTFEGLFGKGSGTLVTEATQRLTNVMPPNAKFLLMGSEAVALPHDPHRPVHERATLWLLGRLIPPHCDNVAASSYLREHPEINWSIVRPTNLVDEAEATGKYKIQDASSGRLFGEDVISRANVAHYMVDILTDEEKWEKYKHTSPVLKQRDEESH